MQRHLNKAAIHARAVAIGRGSRNGMAKTANRLAACDVDRAVEHILDKLKPDAWALSDAEIIDGCARHLWTDFCEAEIRLINRASHA